MTKQAAQDDSETEWLNAKALAKRTGYSPSWMHYAGRDGRIRRRAAGRTRNKRLRYVYAVNDVVRVAGESRYTRKRVMAQRVAVSTGARQTALAFVQEGTAQPQEQEEPQEEALARAARDSAPLRDAAQQLGHRIAALRGWIKVGLAHDWLTDDEAHAKVFAELVR